MIYPLLPQQDKSEDDAAKRRSDLARVTNAWIELQEAVNCLMDSSKNTNAATAKTAPSGIRQELERKEVRVMEILFSNTPACQ